MRQTPSNPGNIPQLEGFSRIASIASHPPTKTRWWPVRTYHRVSGLVQHRFVRRVIHLIGHKVHMPLKLKLLTACVGGSDGLAIVITTFRLLGSDSHEVFAACVGMVIVKQLNFHNFGAIDISALPSRRSGNGVAYC